MKRGAIRYSEAELRFIYANRDLPRSILRYAFVAAFGRADVSAAHIKALCTRHGWATMREPFTAEGDAMLRKFFADMPTARVAAMLGRPVGSVIGRARKLGLRKSPEYLATPAAGRLQRGNSTGAAAWYAKGAAPLNKGVKRPEGWSPGRMGQTQYKKAQAPRNWRPIGSVRVIKGYQFTKIADERMVSWVHNWRQTHIVNWEAVNGPIPEGFALKSLDGNRMNTDASNWESVPRAILPRLSGGRNGRVGYDAAPVEIRPTIMLSAKLAHAVKKRNRNKAAA
jgi:hypothetical protein